MPAKKLSPTLTSSTRTPTGAARKQRQGKGQFWTPEWTARAMAAYVLQDDPEQVFDPAIGAGAFQRAVLALSRVPVRLRGCEIDPEALEAAAESGLTTEQLREIRNVDFIADEDRELFPAIIGNPPYLRHHLLGRARKEVLGEESLSVMGERLDGRAGLHIYFLLRSLQRLAPGGRLAFIVPADTAEGVFAPALWRWIGRTYRIEGVATFAPEATPFPGVDTNPLVLFIRNLPPVETLQWARVGSAGDGALERWAQGLGRSDLFRGEGSFQVQVRSLEEALSSGLSRPPSDEERDDGCLLGDIARVMRGIATGNNEYFHLHSDAVSILGIPDEFLIPAVARSRDCPGDTLDSSDMERLDKAGRPTQLLSLDERTEGDFPPEIQRYLEEGVRKGIDKGALVSTRNPWYRMERRSVPPFLFAYLGRRSSRFIKNEAGAVPLSGFLCVYPKDESQEGAQKFWKLISDPLILEGLARVGKSYGSGALKVEPRALERLFIPGKLLRKCGFGTFA